MTFTPRLSRLSRHLLFVVLSLVALTATAFAAEGGQHIAVTPSSAEISVAPGGSIDETMAVVNQGQDSFAVTTSVSPYHVEGVDYDPQFTQLPGTVATSQWVTLHNTQSQSLEPGKLLNISYTVKVPAGTAPGGYYAVIFAQTAPQKATSGVVAHNRVGEILYITVKGPVRASGNVFAGDLAHFNTSGSLSIPTLIQNTGGIHFKTTATVTIKNLFGSKVFSQSLQRYVLPQTERKVVANWSNHIPLGIYRVERQATLPSGTVTLKATWVILVQPWLVVLVLIALLLLIVVWLRQKRERQRKE